jgi:hypothetical protein
MRFGTVTLCRAAVLAGPFVLAFFSGGFFDVPRLVAALAAWSLLAAAALAVPHPLPRGLPGRLALAGLALLVGMMAASIAWSPLPGQAFHDLQRVVLYLGAFALAMAVLRPRRAVRAIEPALAAGCAVVIGWGLADRVLPGLFTHAFSFAAGGRIHQPLTYWNAMGATAAIGLVLCARLAGDTTRARPVRVGAAALCPVLASGLYLTFSRGAVAALGAGLVVLLGGRPTWSALRALAVCGQAATVAVVVAAVLPAVATYHETLPVRERQGAVLLATLGLCALVAGALQAWLCRAEATGAIRAGRLPVGAHVSRIAAACVLLAAAVFVITAANERREPQSSPLATQTPARFASVGSNRYEYWRVAFRSFADHPLAGLGTAGFQVAWLRHRPIRESARNAHSLYLETAAELGIAGVLALGLFVAGVGLAAREAMRRDPAAAVGLLGAVTVFGFHAGIDWDWQMPAVTLPALVAAAGLVVLGEP